jgi:D-psicose/D-tagatose/L-ribulose 3-epimerase
MRKLSYIVVDRPESFGSFQAFGDCLRRVKDLGYNGVECSLARPYGFDVDELVRLTEEIDLPIVSFMTGANYFGEGLCLSSPDPSVRQSAVERLQECTEIGARFGALLVVGQMQGFLTDEPDPHVAVSRIEDALKRVAESAEKHGTTIALEPVNHLQCGFNNTLAEVMALTDRVGSPRVKPMLDTIHINIEETSLTEPIRRLGKNIAHFHLCESNGDFLGTGHLNFSSVFNALDEVGYDRYVSVKVYRRPLEEVAEPTIRYLQKLLGG